MRFSKEFKVGIFAIATITMFYLGFNYLKGMDFFARVNRYYAVYKDVGGLIKSNPVKISGFNVGRVADIRLLQERDNAVLVTMEIDSDIILGDSAVASLSASLLGDVSVVIEVGNLAKPLEPGDTLISAIAPGLTDLLVESTEPITQNLPATIANLNKILEELEGSGEEIKLAIREYRISAQKLNGIMDDNRAAIKTTMDNTAVLSAELKQRAAEAEELMQHLNTLARNNKDIDLSTTVAHLDSVLTEAARLLHTLQSDQGTLGKLMYDEELYNNLNRAVADLDTLLIHIDENPKHFFGPLGKSRKKIERDRAKQAEANQ